MKFKKDDVIVEVLDPNTYNVWERYGFEMIEDEDETPKKRTGRPPKE